MKCTHLCMVECPSLPQGQWEEVSYDGGSMMDLAHLPWCMRGHHLWLETPLHVACPPINLYIPSSPNMSAPSLRQNCQAPMKQYWSINHSTTSVIVLLPCGLVLGLLSQTILEVSNISIDMLVPLCSSYGWEVEVNWYTCSPPRHGVMWVISHYSCSHRALGLHHLWYIVELVGLPILAGFSNHPHNGLVCMFHLPLGLSMVGQSPNLLNPPEFTQLTNNVAHKVHSVITKELGQYSRGQDVLLVQELGNSLSSLIRGNIGHNMFFRMILEDKNVNNFGDWSSSIVISMLI